jgi:Sec-independent protein translocase protein TatA
MILLEGFYVRGSFSTDASFGNLLHRAIGFGPKNLPELRKDVGQGIRALKEGIKETLPDSERVRRQETVKCKASAVVRWRKARNASRTLQRRIRPKDNLTKGEDEGGKHNLRHR